MAPSRLQELSMSASTGMRSTPTWSYSRGVARTRSTEQHTTNMEASKEETCRCGRIEELQMVWPTGASVWIVSDHKILRLQTPYKERNEALPSSVVSPRPDRVILPDPILPLAACSRNYADPRSNCLHGILPWSSAERWTSSNCQRKTFKKSFAAAFCWRWLILQMRPRPHKPNAPSRASSTAFAN